LFVILIVIEMAEESGTLVGSADPWIMTAFAAYSAMLMLKFLLNIMLIIVTRTRLKVRLLYYCFL